ncbi:unnamed protein product [Ectocarpus sp. 4 AP-2014]
MNGVEDDLITYHNDVNGTMMAYEHFDADLMSLDFLSLNLSSLYERTRFRKRGVCLPGRGFRPHRIVSLEHVRPGWLGRSRLQRTGL